VRGAVFVCRSKKSILELLQLGSFGCYLLQNLIARRRLSANSARQSCQDREGQHGCGYLLHFVCSFSVMTRKIELPRGATSFSKNKRVRLRTYPQHTLSLLPLLRSRPGGVHKTSVVRSPKSDNSLKHCRLSIVDCRLLYQK